MKKVQEAIDSFISHCLFEKNLSPKTIKCYRIDLCQLLTYIQNNDYSDELASLDKEIIKAYLHWLSKFKPKTIKRKVATMKTFFNEMELDEFIDINPFRKMRVQIKDPLKLPTVMNSYEVEKIIRTVWESEKANKSTEYSNQQSIRNIAVAELLFATGIRVSELCQLNKENIDIKTGTIKICGKGSKERIVQVCNEEALYALRSYYQLFKEKITETSYFFINRLNNRLSEQSVRLMIKHFSKISGLTKNITPHTFRHSFATLLLEENVDIKYIQHLLGHSSIMTTQIYTHVNTEKKIEILSIKHPRKNFKVMS